MCDQKVYGNLAIFKPEYTDDALRFLILDDCKFDRCRLRRLVDQVPLHRRVEWVEVDTLSSFFDMVEMISFDLIFVDYFLPVGNGAFALEFLLQTDLNNASPVVLVTGAPEFPEDIKLDNQLLCGVISKGGMGISQVEETLSRILFPNDSQSESLYDCHNLFRNSVFPSLSELKCSDFKKA